MPTLLIIPLTSAPWTSLTPADVFRSLSHEPTLFWLDSGDAKTGWTYLGVHPQKAISTATLLRQSAVAFPKRTTSSAIPPFTGGWIVHLDYPDAVTSATSPRTLIHNSLNAHFYESIFAYSHADRTWFCLSNSYHLLSLKRRRDKVKNTILFSQIRENIENSSKNTQKTASKPCINDLTTYRALIQRALLYIRSGDIYQVNLAKSFTLEWSKSAPNLYLRLRTQSPAAYGAFLGTGLRTDNRAICSISPESFLRGRFGKITTRPIKGTRPRGETSMDSERSKHDLASSEKERAELNMIVDLERNDLGRICTFGSVRVEHNGEIEELPTLFHRSASISGQLRMGTTIGAVLEATFPGGSITGAPKLRAMEIIAELEPEPRGPYCGAIGWVGTDGNFDLNIAIRTAVVDPVRQEACYFAGSGIVADSIPDKECEETLLKAAAFFKAIESQYV